jgi:hypothetical protein
MSRTLFLLVAAAGLLASCGVHEGADAPATATTPAAAPAEDGDVALVLPADYRRYGSYMISDRLGQEDQVIALFANDVARDGARADGELPYGSVIVGEIYKASTDADGVVELSEVGRRIPAEPAAIVMMERRPGNDERYPANLQVGDWEFEVFSPAGDNLAKDTTACRECHAPLAETEFTFSHAHLAGAN